MLPHIFRSREEAYFARSWQQLLDAGFDGILAKNLEEAVWLREKGNRLPVGLDSSVYSWNSAANETLKELGAAFFTLPLELTRREMEPVVRAGERRDFPAELVIYGYYPMMVTAQCPVSTAEGCSHTPKLTSRRSSTGMGVSPRRRQAISAVSKARRFGLA